MRKVNKILHSGESVLIPRKGSLNNILLVSGDFWTIDTMFFSIPRMPNVAKYVYLFLSGVDMYAMNIGAAVPSMTVKILDGMKVLCPSTEILAQFEKVVGPYFSMIELLKKKNEALTEARDLLLPKLMNGEIEV
jgi:type I restriction enzyme S subunit